MYNLVKLLDAVDVLVALNVRAGETEALGHRASTHKAMLDVWEEVVRLTGCPILWDQLVGYQHLSYIQANVPTQYNLVRYVFFF